MRPSLQALYTKFAGRQVFIIGGGNSLTDFDFSLLENKNTIAINSAYEFVPNASCLYWCDNSWSANNLDSKRTQGKIGLNDHPCNERFTSWINAASAIKSDIRTVGGAAILHKTGDYGIDLNPDCVRGNNSGTQALNLAVNMGAREIILMGIDLKYINKKSHFHDKHYLQVKETVYSELFIPAFESMAKEIKKMKNVKVLNASLHSALKCFKKIRLQDII